MAKYTARQRLKDLEHQLTRLDPKKREVYYLKVDPELYKQALDLTQGALEGQPASDSEERPETPSSDE